MSQGSDPQGGVTIVPATGTSRGADVTTEPPRLGQWDSFEELRRLQEERLTVVFERAARSPFYQKRFPGGGPTALGGLVDVPLTSKEDLRASYPFRMLAVPRNRVSTYHESSGSSGTPISSYFTADEWVELAERFNRKSVELSSADTLMVRVPYAMVLVGHLGHLGALSKGATVVPGGYRSLSAAYSQIVRLMRDVGVTVTWSNPSEALVLAAAAQLAGYDPAKDFPALRALYVAGEPMSAARRARIEQLWDRPVVEEYGCTEIGPMGGTCPHGQLHFFADRVLPEVLDPQTGAISRDGVGRLVLTPLFREAMPLLRYDLEDRVEIRFEDCPCGWHLPTLRVLGRMLHTYPTWGKTLSSVQVEESVFRLPVDHGVLFWRARAEEDRLVLQIEVTAEGADAACAALHDNVEAVLGVPVEVSAVAPGTLVPHQLLNTTRNASKPQRLFGPGEDWEEAILRS